ncbi:MAG: hypothetical protein HKP10_07425, partial [Kiritimatiellales bacterium]|nr:hypothetical protein [Kiritimatiellales bacterium]
LESRFGSWAIPHLALYLIGIQVIGVILLMGNYVDYNDLFLHGSSVIHRGQWWRLLSFMMLPRTMSPLWLFFAFYIFYMIGNALEEHWGTFRFNLFILSGYLLTLLTAFISPGAIITNTYFLGCAFLAFATLFPHVEFRLFFILPVKVKWLGWLTVVLYVLTLFVGDIGSRLGVLAAFANYLIFFGKAFFLNFKAETRRKAFVAERVEAAAQPLHVCSECGVSDKSDEAMHFRYCSTCGKCYCEEHIGHHAH